MCLASMKQSSKSPERSTESLNRFEYTIALVLAVIAGFAYCAAVAIAMAWRKAKLDFRLRKYFAQMRIPQWVRHSVHSRRIEGSSALVQGNAGAAFIFNNEADKPQ